MVIGLVAVALLLTEILLIIFLPLVGWTILALVGVVLTVALLVPLGVHACYDGANFSLAAKIGFYECKILPKNNKSPDKKKKPKNQKPEKIKAVDADSRSRQKNKFKLNFKEMLELARSAIKALGKFGKLTVHKFMLHYVAGGNDPYSTAMSFNYVNAALSSLAPLCAKNLRIKDDVDVCTNIDFTAEKTQLAAELCITLRLIQLLRVALVVGWRTLIVFIKNKRRISKEAKLLEKSEIIVNNTNKDTDIKIKTEERVETNGE